MTRDMRAGLECHVRMTVPIESMTRRGVMRRKGGKVRRIQIGVTRTIRIVNDINAGLVVAEVAVRWVERKSVSSSKGSSKILHLVVNVLRVSTISSKLF